MKRSAADNVIIEARKISKSFPGVRALHKVDFKAYAGKVNVVVGENGAGKSTLMNILSGVYTEYDGELLLNSKKIRFNDIPKVYYAVPCIHLGPVFNEIDPGLIDELRDVFKIISLEGQGFTRSTDSKDGSIVLKPWVDYKDYFHKIDILKVDDFELKGIIGTNRLKEAIDLALATGLQTLVITRAHKGAIIYHEGRRYDISAYQLKLLMQQVQVIPS